MGTFFFTAATSTGLCSLSLHDALPISVLIGDRALRFVKTEFDPDATDATADVFDLGDRKSTRLNSSHVESSYAVFCLKKKNRQTGIYASFHKNIVVLYGCIVTIIPGHT